MTNGETPKSKPRCRFISKIGSRCQADPQTGKDYCFFHDPEQKKKQAEARKQGGEARSRQIEPELTLPPDLPAVSLQKAGDVYDLINETVHHLQCRKMDVRIAQAIGYLAALVLRALKADQSGLAHLLSGTISEVRRGETDLRTAKTIGNLTAIMLTALKQEAEEQAASAMATQAPRSPESVRQAMPNSLAALGRRLGIEPVINGMAATNTAAHPEAMHA